MSSLPPGQQLVARDKWPLVGERAAASERAVWTVEVTGQVAQPRVWTLDELQRLPAVERTIDIHCVTRWSKLNVTWRGVLLASLLEHVQPVSAARFVSFVAHSQRGHSSSLRLEDALRLETMLAWQADGAPLAATHGGPLRSVTAGRYFYKSVKWVRSIELLDSDRLGYWEAEAGYHNEADPWRQQRYLAARLSKQQAARLLAARDFRELDLLGIQAAGRELAGLRAERALLRNADFRDARLDQATFDGANLSNAHFQRSSLKNASFVGADLEGANFEEADLSSARFTGASLFGATFTATPDSEGSSGGARFDKATQIDLAALDQLTDQQAEYVRAQLRSVGRL